MDYSLCTFCTYFACTFFPKYCIHCSKGMVFFMLDRLNLLHLKIILLNIHENHLMKDCCLILLYKEFNVS